ncbi:MAG: hypothetical protein GY771_16605 [bacterium]|nr:hypothetical protein [bacterium]
MNHQTIRIFSSFASILMTVVTFFYLGCAQIGIPPGAEDLTDKEPPRLEKAYAPDQYHVRLEFDEPMDIASGRDESLYRIVTDEGMILPVRDVIPAETVDALVLVTERQEKGVKYYVTVRNIRDAEGGNPIGRHNHKSFKGSGNADEKAPVVIGTYPPDGAEAIGLYPIITVIFNDVIAADSFAEDTIVLTDDLGREIPGEIEVKSHSVNYIPGERLDFSTRYSFIVHDVCTDIAGNILYRERSFAFTTIVDTEEVTLSGKVSPKGVGIEAGGCEVFLLMTPNPEAEDVFVASYVRADEEGKFKLRGIAPNGENVPVYYVSVRKDNDGDGTFEWTGITDADGDGLADSLAEMKRGDRLSGTIVYLEAADKVGPVTEGLLFAPNPTNGQRGGYIYARFEDDSANIVAGEAFLDYRGSDGTGLAMNALNGDWGTSPEIAAERYITDLREFKAHSTGEHLLYVHARDAKGNWGDFAEYRFDVTSKKKPSYSISGMIDFDLEPAEGAVVSAWPAASPYPAAVTRTDKKGRFELDGLSAGEYRVEVFGDSDGDSLKGPNEPSAVTRTAIKLSSYDYTGLDLILAYAPNISDANARLQNYSAGEGRAELLVTAVITDRDSDVSRVWVVLPTGDEVELSDDGADADVVAGDGIYTYGVEYENDAVPSEMFGEVTVSAEDSFGNVARAGAVGYPGLGISGLPDLTGIDAEQEGNGIRISWGGIEGAEGGYVVFIVPYDRFERFTEPGTAEVWSNYRNPLYTSEVLVQYKSIEDWWAYPTGAVCHIVVAAAAGDGTTFRASDKSLTIVTIRKEDIETALPGAGE